LNAAMSGDDKTFGISIPEVVVLHRYWMYANFVRIHFEEELTKQPPNTAEKDARKIVHDAFMFGVDKRGAFMSHWYGSLYVVIEGWKELQLTDPEIDALIASENVKLLKRYRNGVFHFQRKFGDDRFQDFYNSQDSVAWVREIHYEFGRYFLETIRQLNASENQG
jgi:hypothetical protein